MRAVARSAPAAIRAQASTSPYLEEAERFDDTDPTRFR
jgi:hypothetical protein